MIVKLNVPPVLGVPLNCPFVARVSPDGNAPDVTVKEYGVVPPAADKFCE